MQEYGPVADEWSVGMLMYQLLTGVFPFWDSVQNVSLQQVLSPSLPRSILPTRSLHRAAKGGRCMQTPVLSHCFFSSFCLMGAASHTVAR